MTQKEVIHNTVGAVRQKRSITQEALAEAVSVSRQTISALEKGNYTPSVALALKIAAQFSVPVEELFLISYE